MKRVSIKKVFLALVIIFIVFTVFFGTESIPQYRTTQLQIAEVKKEVEFTTNWYPIGYAQVSLGNSLDIVKIYVKEGQEVKKGAALVKLKDETEYYQYKAALSSYYAAIKAKQNSEKTPGVPQATLDSLQGQINVAYYQMKNAQAALNRKVVKSPISGKIVEIVVNDFDSAASTSNLLAGATASTTGNYLVVANTSDPSIEIGVSDKDVVKLQKNMEVSFTNRLTDEVLKGQITAVSKVPVTAAAQDPVYKMRIRLDIYPVLPYGTQLEGAVIISKIQDARSLQYDAITIESADKGTVLVLRNGVAEPVTVTVGTVGDDMIEIEDGLESSDLVIVDKLADKKVIAFRPWIKNLFGSK